MDSTLILRMLTLFPPFQHLHLAKYHNLFEFLGLDPKEEKKEQSCYQHVYGLKHPPQLCMVNGFYIDFQNDYSFPTISAPTVSLLFYLFDFLGLDPK